MTQEQEKLYKKTVKRLARGGINDPTAQIIALAEEIERYREKIYGLEDLLQQSTETYEKIISMFRPADGDFLDFKAEEVIQDPNDRAIFGFDTKFPLEWLVADYGFTEDEARWFISEVRRLNEKEEA